MKITKVRMRRGMGDTTWNAVTPMPIMMPVMNGAPLIAGKVDYPPAPPPQVMCPQITSYPSPWAPPHMMACPDGQQMGVDQNGCQTLPCVPIPGYAPPAAYTPPPAPGGQPIPPGTPQPPVNTTPLLPASAVSTVVPSSITTDNTTVAVTPAAVAAAGCYSLFNDTSCTGPIGTTTLLVFVAAAGIALYLMSKK